MMMPNADAGDSHMAVTNVHSPRQLLTPVELSEQLGVPIGTLLRLAYPGRGSAGYPGWSASAVSAKRRGPLARRVL